MNDKIMELVQEILKLTREQKRLLETDDIDAVNALIAMCARLTGELGTLLTSGDIPQEAYAALDEIQKLSDEQKNIALDKRARLVSEYTETKRSYETADAYESSFVSGYETLGSIIDKRL